MEIKSGGCEVFSHLIDLKEISNKEKKFEIIQSEYQRLSAEAHPVRKAMHFMNTIEEIAIIEGKK